VPEASKAREKDPKWRSSADISVDIRAASKHIIADRCVTGSSPATALKDFLTQYLPWPYQVDQGSIFDETGTESQRFEVVVYVGALVGGGTPIWTIAYHESKFEDT